MNDSGHMAPLAAFHGRRPAAPAWFDDAISHAPERGLTEVEGARIETLAWGMRGAPGLILLHGGAAHADWWSFIAPLLAARRRVVALSFSGMGRSDWRSVYELPQLAREAREAGRAAGAFDAGRPTIVGHSFGGRVALACAGAFGEDLASAVLVDPPLFAPENQRSSSPPRYSKGHRAHASLAALIARFRLSPPQPCENAFILDHIARLSARAGADASGLTSWTLAFDPEFWSKLVRIDGVALLTGARCATALMRGGRSDLFSPVDAAFVLSRWPLGSPYLEIPEAHHHVMIDQPLAFVAALEALLAAWPPASAVSPVSRAASSGEGGSLVDPPPAPR